MRLIGLAGKARSGKDTAARLLVDEFLMRQYGFADPIKKAIVEMFGIDPNVFFDDGMKEKVDPFWGISPRQMAQKLGTEGGRLVFGEDIWIKRADLAWRKLRLAADRGCMGGKPVNQGMVVSDVRYDNEADWVLKNNGIVIKIIRQDASEVSSHCSEAGISSDRVMYTLHNNATISEMFEGLRGIMKMEGVVSRPTYTGVGV